MLKLSLALVSENLVTIAILARRRRHLLKRFILATCTYESVPAVYFGDRSPFDLQWFTDDECKKFFRFDRPHVAGMMSQFRLPDVVKVRYYRVKIPAVEAVCIFLFRMAYPCRWVLLRTLFRRPVCVLSKLFAMMIRHIYLLYEHLLNLDLSCMKRPTLRALANIMRRRGAPHQRAWGMLDGTYRRIPRPTQNQGVFYTGYKRYHAIKFLSITLPTGIIAMIDGPYAGSKNDATLFNERLKTILETHADFVETNGDPFVLLADSGT